MITENLWPQIQGHPWKYEPRTNAIDILLVHATRSGQPGYSSRQDYLATKNWFISPNNRTVDSQGRVSAGMTNCIIGDSGKLAIALPDNYYPTWSAGHMDPRAKSYELAQATNDTPFDPLDVERLQHEIALDCKRYGIPAKHIQFMNGNNEQAPGIAYHDASSNGVALGKSDPGKMPPFNNRPLFVAQIAQLLTPEEEDMRPFLAWDLGRKAWYFVGPAGAKWVTTDATIKELKAQFGPLEEKALSTSAIQALGG